MPGILGYNLRQGDRSEYLALYFLSALGVSVLVPRPEDIGADFQCVLARKEGAILTFKSPYIVQVKSATEELAVKYGGYDAQKVKWFHQEIQWLFSQEVPFLLAVVSKAEASIEIFSTSPMWRVLYSSPNPAEVVLRPGVPGVGSDVGFADPVTVEEWPAGVGDRKRWEVLLGPPLVRLQGDDAENQETVERARLLLDWALQIEQQNITYRRMGVPYFTWPLKIVPNDLTTIGPVGAFFGWSNMPQAAFAQQIERLKPLLLSLALHLKGSGMIDDLQKLKGAIELIPHGQVPPFVVNNLPEIFGH